MCISNKNTLTGPANCKKTTRHLGLKPNFRPKTSLEPFLRKISVSDFGLIWRFSVNISKSRIFFQKSGSMTFVPSQSLNCVTNQLTSANLETFSRISPIKNFFQKPNSVTFLPLQFTNFMQKIRKIYSAVSEKTALPTNQLLPITPISQGMADAERPSKNN